ncbi:hypothetical protein Fmac_001170 [Flemingia macrophylla]|uniref:Uncharacterized protein n=1 Tax=Flemingia macrophylla TaxID=520843 RepID=A0ABD1NGC9_9FABA
MSCEPNFILPISHVNFVHVIQIIWWRRDFLEEPKTVTSLYPIGVIQQLKNKGLWYKKSKVLDLYMLALVATLDMVLIRTEIKNVTLLVKMICFTKEINK